MRSLAIAVLAAALCFAGPAGAAGLSGSARVIDGDTLAVGDVVVRLHGIDAPESGQWCKDGAGRDFDCGKAATDALSALVAGATVGCAGDEWDRYGRLIAVCHSGGVELNRSMAMSGWAVAFLRYSDAYAADQAAAARARRGLWAGTFEAPWSYRAHRWSVASASAPEPRCPIKGNISAAGRIYHTPYSRAYDRTVVTPSKGERWFCSEAEAIAAGWRAPNR